MGTIRCLNCRNAITTISGMECPHCKAQLSHVKIAFLSYLGPEDSLAGYQRSYKLVLIKSVFELVKAGQPISVARVSERFRQYYLDRKQAGLPADKDADIRVSNVEKSDLRDIWLLINMNPYAAIAKHGFLKMKGDGLSGTFVLQKGIDSLTKVEIDSLLNIVEKKLTRYFASIGSTVVKDRPADAIGLTAEPASTVRIIEEISAEEAEAPAGPQESTVQTENIPLTASAESTYSFGDAPADTPLEDLPLSNRAYNALRRSGMTNLGQLKSSYNDGSIADIKNIGKTVIQEIGQLLALHAQPNEPPTTPLSEQASVPHDGAFLGNMDDAAKALKIEDVFFENAFNLFRQYCKRNGIETIGQLIGLSYDKLQNERGFGKGKIAKIIERWTEVENGTTAAQEASVPVDAFEAQLPHIHPSNVLLNINALYLLGGSRKVQNGLHFLGIETLGDLCNVSIAALERKFRPEQITELRESVAHFAKPYHEILDDLFNAVAKEESFDLFVKRAIGNTLQTVAEEYGVTREWVRQICAKAERKIIPLLKPLMEELMDQNGARYLREEQVREYIDNESYASAVIYTLRNGTEFTSFGSPVVFFEAVSFPDVQNRLAELASDIVGDGINIFESANDIENTLESACFGFLTADDFLGLLITLDYKFYGDYVLKDRKTYGRLCARIVEDHFPDGISNTKEDMDLLRELTKQAYGDLDLPNSDRAVYARICDYLILRGRSKYIAPAKVYIDADILAEIKKAIDESKQKDVFYAELFAEFEGLLLMMTNIDNHQFLHGVLRYYYPADYSYSRDFLSKESGEAGQSLADRITGYVTDIGTAVHKKDILRHFPGITEVVLFNTAYNFSGLLQWEYNYYNALANLHLTENDVKEIDRVLGSLIDANDGYCSERMLFDRAKEELGDILEKGSIETPMNLFYTAQELLEEKYVFRSPHIARIDRFRSMIGIDIAADLLGPRDTLSTREFYQMTNRLKWPAGTAGLIFTEIEQGYVRTASDTYIRKDLLPVSDKDTDYLKTLFENQAEGNWYLPLQLFADSEEELPCGLQINEFLIGSVAAVTDLGWRIVAPQIKDRRYQRGILIRYGEKVHTYDQLVAAVLKENNISEISEGDLLSFLVIRSLALRYLPKDLQTSPLFRYAEGIYTIP